MPKTRKNRNSRKRTGGLHPHPAGTPYDNKGRPLPLYPNNRLSRVATPPRFSPTSPNYGAPPPIPPPLVRAARPYDRSEQQDLSIVATVLALVHPEVVKVVTPAVLLVMKACMMACHSRCGIGTQ